MALPAFTNNERESLHALLAAKVAAMMRRKMEEADWTEVYCLAKGIPYAGWSNRRIDVAHDGVGVEHKMLAYYGKKDISSACGETWMHPSSTRCIRLPAYSTPPDDAMRIVVAQYRKMIAGHAKDVRATKPKAAPDVRTGWLIWQSELRQFLYFEEQFKAPNPANLYAKWNKSRSTAGSSLWVYDRRTDKKVFSVTGSDAGAKWQPYFTIPGPRDPYLYMFSVIGEVIGTDVVRCWITKSTLEELRRLLGSVTTEKVSAAIRNTLSPLPVVEQGGPLVSEPAVPLRLSVRTYELLRSRLPGVNDDHCFQLLIQAIKQH